SRIRSCDSGPRVRSRDNRISDISWNVMYSGRNSEQLTLQLCAQLIGFGLLWIGGTDLIQRGERIRQVTARRQRACASQRELAPAWWRQALLAHDGGRHRLRGGSVEHEERVSVHGAAAARRLPADRTATAAKDAER